MQRTPKLLECTRESLLACIVQCAQLGLEPDGLLGQAYLIPFYNGRKNRYECQLIVGYKGLLKLARQSAEISSLGQRHGRPIPRLPVLHARFRAGFSTASVAVIGHHAGVR